MKVLLVGGGGREHAIAEALRRSPQVDKLYCAPGNAGIAKIAKCVPIGTMDFDALTAFAKDNKIDLTASRQLPMRSLMILRRRSHISRPRKCLSF